MNFAATYCNRIVMMAKGVVIGEGIPRDVFMEQAWLELANVQPPTLVALSRQVGLKQVSLGVDEFVAEFIRERLDS